MVAAKRGSSGKLASVVTPKGRKRSSSNAPPSVEHVSTEEEEDSTISSSHQSRNYDSLESPTKEHKFVPPRSKEFYRVGPEFKRTSQNFQLSDPTGKPLYTIISARIDRGFQKTEDDSWLSYRRNYFTLAASFSIVEKDKVELGKVPPYPVHVSHGDVTSPVQSFAIRLTAFRVCNNGETEEIPLIQHTPKRDKGPRQPPAIVPAVPGVLPDHDFMRDNANYRSSAQLRKVEPFFYRSKSLLGPFTENYPTEKVAHVVLFDRVQFTTAGGGGSQICKAAVQLIVTLNDAVSYVVAWCETPPFTLRNRSPGNYYEDGTLIPRSRKGFSDSPTATGAPIKRKNSFVAERPDLKIPKSSQAFHPFDATHEMNLVSVPDKVEYKKVIFSAKPEALESSVLVGESSSVQDNILENETAPEHVSESLVEPKVDPELEPENKVETVPEKRKRGRPKVVKGPSKPPIEEKPSAEPVEEKGRHRRTRKKPEPEVVKVEQIPPKTRTRRQKVKEQEEEVIKDKPNEEPVVKPQPFTEQVTDNTTVVDDSDSDSDEFEESEEEMRKRDLMRLRSGSMHLGATSRPYLGVSTAATASPAITTFEFMSQSPIGRARPSASRETFTPGNSNGGDGPMSKYSASERTVSRTQLGATGFRGK